MYQFKDEKFLSASEKENILQRWIRFLKNGLRREDFTKSLYTHLHVHCDFIAHTDIHGFYEEYFLTGADKIRFLKNFDRDEMERDYHLSYKLTGSCGADLNKAMVDEAEKFLPVLYAGAISEQKQLDLKIVQRLLERHGLTLDDVVKPLKTPAVAAPAGTQTNLF